MLSKTKIFLFPNKSIYYLTEIKIFAFMLFGLSVGSTFAQSFYQFVDGNNLFTADIYKKIALNENENFVVSPFSVETALAFLQSGCEGETAEEIQNALHLPNSKDKIEYDVKTLLPTMIGDDFYTLHTANKMYLKENFQIKETFRKAATEVYYADIENIDFTKNYEAAERMNEWVEKQTENKIHDLIDPNNLDEYTRAVLINALYFKANWSQPFVLPLTRTQTFYKTSNYMTEVLMLYTDWENPKFYNYYESSDLDAKLLELPFTGGDASVIIVLPNEIEGIRYLESKIDRIFGPHSFTHQPVRVAIPKFKIETKTDLKQILRNLGVNKAFDEVEADLSGIAGNKGDIYIDEVVQKTFIDFIEGGVEGAAATFYSPIVLLSARPPSIEFTADHPFIFYVKVKNVIIFAGKIVHPLH